MMKKFPFLLAAKAALAATCLVWAPPVFVDAETPSGARDGANRVFRLAHVPVSGSTPLLVLNGLVLKLGAGNDYALNGATVTFLPGAAIPQNATENLLCWYRWQP